MYWQFDITLTRKGEEYGLRATNSIAVTKYYVAPNVTHHLTIGNSSTSAIYFRQTIPLHANLVLGCNEVKICADKKLTIEWKQKNKLLTRGENLSFSPKDISESPVLVKIKDNTIHVACTSDPNILSSIPNGLQKLESNYGSMIKVWQDAVSFFYQSSHNPALVFRILCPKEAPGIIDSFIKGLKPQNFVMTKLMETIIYPELGLYAGMFHCGGGDFLERQLITRQNLKKSLIICRNILEFYVSKTTFFPIHPRIIWITPHGKAHVLAMHELTCDQESFPTWNSNDTYSYESNNVYLLGNLLYSILTGILDTRIEFPQKQFIYKENTREYLQLLETCLDKNPSRRPSLANLIQQWDNLEIPMENSQEVEDILDDTESRERPKNFLLETGNIALEKIRDISFLDAASNPKQEPFLDKKREDTHAVADLTPIEENKTTLPQEKKLPQMNPVPLQGATNVLDSVKSVPKSVMIQSIFAENPSSTTSSYKTLEHLLAYWGKTKVLATGLITLTILFLGTIVFIWHKNKEIDRLNEFALWRKTNEQIVQTLELEYNKSLGALPLHLDTLGLTEDAKELEKYSNRQFRLTQNRKHAIRLAGKALPAYRNLANISQSLDDKQSLMQLLHMIIFLFPTEEERQPYRLELSLVQGISEDALEHPATILIRVIPSSATKHIYKYVEYPSGQQMLVPVDVTTGNDIVWNKTTTPKILGYTEFLRAQNLLYEAVMFFLDKNIREAKFCLLRAIEIQPDYLDAYFLLACIHCEYFKTMDTKQPFPQANNTEKVESFGEEKNAGVELWKKRGLEVIARTNVAEDAKQALRAKFTAEFIQNAYKIYSYLPQKTDQDRGNYLIKIGSAASKNAQLQSGDYIVRVDEVPINSLETLQAIYRGKNFLSCKILRNWEIISLDIPITEYNDNEFYAMEVPPILYIADNQILGFTATNTLYSMPDDLIYLQENKIQNDTISLFPGSYLLVCQASGHFSVQYPFMVSCGNTNNEDISLGEPYGEPIFLNMPKYPSNGEEWDSKFCVIPRGFLTSTSPEEQNNMGFLLGRFEVTLGDWYEYLKGVHGPKPWKIEKIQNRIPMLTANKPAFYIRDGELILRGSEMTWPVVGVSYSQVQDYIIWKNQNLPEIQPQMKFRLPTLSEWICAMQGADKRSYPWGNYPNARFAKIATSRPYVTNTEAIHHSNASFILDVSPFGVYGLAGNVSEYTSTFRHYGNMAQYAVKGSAWNDSLLSDIDYVSYVFANLQRNNRGFRLCCGLDPLYHH